MTQTTTAPLTIPATGLVHTAGDVVITAIPTPQAGYRIQVRIAGVFNADLSSGHVFEVQALRAWAALLEQFPAAPEPTPAAPTIPAQRPATPIPGNAGGHLHVSDPSHTVLAIAAMHPAGIVEQGGKLGQATVTQIRSLAKKGYLDAVIKPGTRFTIIAGRITERGRQRLAELTAADRDAADKAARLAAALTINTAA